MEKRKYKLLAFILILSLVFPFFPSVKVAATSMAHVPDFPFGQDGYYNVNNGSFALWQVHGSNYISWVQTFTPNDISYPNPIVIFKNSFLESNNRYYLDYTYIIDSWDILGNHQDGYAGTQNISIPKPNETYVEDSDVYATLLYTTDNVMWRNGSDAGIYAYWNFVAPSYADPTPTPQPQPSIGSWNSYPDLPSNFSANTLAIMKYHKNGSINDGQLIGLASSAVGSSASYSYPIFYKDRSNYNFNSQAFCNNAITFNTWLNWYSFSVFSVNYDENTDVYSVGSNLFSGSGSSPNGWYVNYSYNWRGETLACWSVVPNNQLSIYNIDAATYEFDDSYFEILFTNKNYVPGSSENPFISPTPEPTAIPTAIPQPTTNPNATPTPQPDVKVVQPSDHWWDGIVKPIQYIFVPSRDKMVNTYNAFANKFGVQKPTKFEFTADSLVRPNNVVWKFKHVSLDGSDTTETSITLIDFELIDGWLETSAGRMIIRIIRAVFGLLMWGYLMYIFRKHIATINYTDAETLKDISRNNGGDEDV